MPKRLIFKDSSEQFSTLPAGYTALVSTDGDFKKQVESTVTTLGTGGGATGPAGAVGATGPAGAVGATGPAGSGGFSLSELGFTIVSQPSIISQDITLPDNSEFTYPDPLIIADGYTLTVPEGTTLTIV